MAEKTIKINIPLLIPGLTNTKDECLKHLENSLSNRRGISRAHIDSDASPPVLCLHYDPDYVSLQDVRRVAERAGTRIANRFHHDTIPVEGVDCSDCVLVLEHSLSRMEGVLDVKVSYAAQKIFIEYNTKIASRQAIEKRIQDLGYGIIQEGVRRWYDEHRLLLFSLISGILLLCGWLGERLAGIPEPVSLVVYLGAYLAGGWHTARHAWQAVKMRAFDTDLLMVSAAIGSAILGQFAEGALLLFLFSIGHAMEGRVLERTRAAIRALAHLSPQSALVVREGGEFEVPVDEIGLNETVVVRPGDRLPVDGIVIEGTSSVDQSPLTGESIPISKGAGDPVLAGSLNGEGVLHIKATRLAKDSTIARVIRMVEQAQAQKSPTQQFTERFMRWFVPSVLIFDALVIVIPPLFGVPFSESFIRAMTLLVAASPCALALGTPAAILAGIARGARHGLLIKGGAHLENLGKLKAIAFDKTGTVTQGKLKVTDIIPFDCLDADGLLALAATIESRSTHPLAQAIQRAAREKNIVLPVATRVREITGQGVAAEVEGKEVWVGRPEIFRSNNGKMAQRVHELVTAFEGEGKTTLIISRTNQPIGIIALADVIRPDVSQVLEALERLGLRKIIMLTGDNQRAAGQIASQARFSSYLAELLPEDKVQVVKDLVAQEGVVAMVGDGINDAPALAHATVGICMGSAGNDVALETADVALMTDDLSKLPFAVGLGRATRKIITQNLILSLATIATLTISALSGWADLGATVAVHESATIMVALNAIRLLKFNFRE